MQRHSIALAVVTTAILVVACGSDTTVPVSNTVTLKATMTGSGEATPNASTATGTFTATLDTSTNVFTYDLTFTGLTAAASSGHIHGPGTVGVSAGVILSFSGLPSANFSSGVTAGTGHGVTTLNAANQFTAGVNGDSLKKLLLAGLSYTNIHTSQYPPGEIRGQITKQ